MLERRELGFFKLKRSLVFGRGVNMLYKTKTASPENSKDAVMIIYAFDMLLSVSHKAHTIAEPGALRVCPCGVENDVYVVVFKISTFCVSRR